MYSPVRIMDLCSECGAVPQDTTRGAPNKNKVKWLTFTFMVLWFFFVFFRNCFRLPEDMYSVMKMTCEETDRAGVSVFKEFVKKEKGRVNPPAPDSPSYRASTCGT